MIWWNFSSGILGDATIIDAPSSTPSKSKARNPEMSSTNKSNDWFFSMKTYFGADADSGTAHSLDTATGKIQDSQIWNDLLHGDERSVWADKGSVSAVRQEAFENSGKVWGVMCKAERGGELHPVEECVNHVIAMVCAKVEHHFQILKCQLE